MHLELGFNMIAEVGAARMAQALHRNTTLTFLGLGFNQVTDAGARRLVHAMPQSCGLRQLSLHGNPISPETGAMLASVLFRNQHRLPHHSAPHLRLPLQAVPIPQMPRSLHGSHSSHASSIIGRASVQDSTEGCRTLPGESSPRQQAQASLHGQPSEPAPVTVPRTTSNWRARADEDPQPTPRDILQTQLSPHRLPYTKLRQRIQPEVSDITQSGRVRPGHS